MKRVGQALGLLLAATVATALAPLEPQDGSGIMFGIWYERLWGDTPSTVNDRMAPYKAAFFQGDLNISSTINSVQGSLEDLLSSVAATQSRAWTLVTLNPNEGLDAVTDDAIVSFANSLVNSLDADPNSNGVLIRYAPEMNGNWFIWNQKPKAFKASYRRFVTVMKKHLGKQSKKVGFLWAPMAGDGYPYGNGAYTPKKDDPDFEDTMQQLDTNQNGHLDIGDDPYSPYYPGDDYVDWVGFSEYFYGPQAPWVNNVMPFSGLAEGKLIGSNCHYCGVFNFYSMFCGDGSGGGLSQQVSKGGKPFILTETAAVFHLLRDDNVVPDPGPGRLAMKQAWWRQVLNSTFQLKYPKVKAYCSFEFEKREEYTLRDFSILGPVPHSSNPDIAAQVNAAFKSDLAHFPQWGVKVIFANQEEISLMANSILEKAEAAEAVAAAMSMNVTIATLNEMTSTSDISTTTLYSITAEAYATPLDILSTMSATRVSSDATVVTSSHYLKALFFCLFLVMHTYVVVI